MSTTRRLVGGAGSLLSQVVSSGGNFLLVVIAARSGSSEQFGHVAIGLALFTLAMGAVRAFVGEASLVRMHRTSTVGPWNLAASVAFYIGIMMSGPLALFALAIGGEMQAVLLALALCVPWLLVLDVARYLAFAQAKPLHALFLDLAWLAGFLAAESALPADWGSGGVWFAWCASGSAVGGVSLLASHRLRGPRSALDWARTNVDLGGPYLAEYALGTATIHAPQLLLGAVAGPTAVAGIRGSISVFGPLTILYTGAHTGILPHLKDRPEYVLRAALGLSGLLSLVAAALTAILIVLPSDLGVAVLGDTWNPASEVVAPMGLAMIATVSGGGALLGLRALQAARSSLRARLLAAPALLIGQLAGAILDGARGFAIGYALGAAVASLLLWHAFAVALRSPASHRSGPDSPSAASAISRRSLR